jgi:hypothetical protein
MCWNDDKMMMFGMQLKRSLLLILIILGQFAEQGLLLHKTNHKYILSSIPNTLHRDDYRLWLALVYLKPRCHSLLECI